MGMSSSFPPFPDEKDMVSLLRTAVERGVIFFDTAQVYGPFTNEELVGEALSPLREQVVIATKFGFELSTGLARGLDSRPESIKRTVDESLSRLQTDYIDLLYQCRGREELNTRADRARLDPRAEALDGADPGHDEAAPLGGEHLRPTSS